MLNMIRNYNLAVLPIHDSFLVRADYAKQLADQMSSVFEKHTGSKTELKLDKALPDPDSNLVVIDGILDQSSLSTKVHIDYSMAYNYINSNPNASFYS